MRVLHVDSARDWRGGQNQVLLTAAGMAERGHDVVVACQAGGVLEGRARLAALDVRPLAFRGDLSPSAALSLKRVITDVRPDVVQLHDPHAVAAAFVPVSLGRVRAVATRRVDFRLRGLLSRVKYRSCPRVIAVSRAIAETLLRDGLAEERLRIVYEGVPVRTAVAGGEERLAALGIPAGSPVVGNVAALTRHKDHETLMEAAALVLLRVPEAHFVAFGQGELQPFLEARARTLGLGGHWIFPGFRSDLDQVMPAFTVFCLSSRMEGLGTSLLDAMAFARPVVATAAGGIPEAVVDGVTGRIVPPGNPKALADALVELLLDPVRQAAMGAAGQRRFLETFTAGRMVEETLRVYQELL